MASSNRSAATDPSNNGANTMGSMSATTTTTTTTTGKKKFGKNLNKLTKPPPPAASETSKSNAASRNGLLLLSTNKRNSSSGPTNGLLASKPTVAAPLPSLGLQYESTTSTHDVLLGAVVGAAASRAEQTPDAWGVAAAANNSSSSQNQTIVNGSNSTGPETPTRESKTERVPEPHREETVLPSSNWDEYGGRDTKSSRGLVSTDRPPDVVLTHSNNQQEDNHVDSQQAYMAKLARDRSERKRMEDAARTKDQQEKAAQRLRALESKMEGDNPRNGVVLEPLGGQAGISINTPPPARSNQRTLYDPNRTYSSLVGGQGVNGVHDGNANASSAGGSIGSRDRGSVDQSPRTGATPGAYSGPVIHLNSYEDRDRGEAPRPAAPRMLFDPKSGSMVAVPTREENPRGGKNKRDKRGRGKNGDEENGNSRGKPVKGGKNGKKGGKPAAKSSAKKNIVNTERKLPRTRGVLYARDDKGNCYCADGCDGDLGYGAHSVHGGRVRNPDAYAKFIEQQQQLYKEQMAENGDDQDAYGSYDLQHGHNGFQSTENSGLATGFSMEQEDSQPQMQMDWVKPNEKIELVTGMDDESPTLQATAREWAPSQAALAAAAQAAALPSLGSQDEEDTSDSGLPVNLEPRDNPAANVLLSINMRRDEDEDDDDIVVPSFIGLGFDPTRDMDAVIDSPAKVDPASAVDGVDFGALSLDPPLCGINANNHNHIFAFGSSATWGTGGDSFDWGAPMLPGSSNAGTISSSRLFGDVLGTTPEDDGSLGDGGHDDDAFLSLTTGIPGFLGTEDEVATEHMVGGD